MTPFDFVNAINSSKKNDIIAQAEDPNSAEKQYLPFVVNKSLSYFADTIMYSNAMNLHNILDSKLQFDYLLNSIRPAKRFSKWVKTENDDDLELIKKYYGYSTSKAKQVKSLFSSNQLSIIRKQLEEGGITNDKS